MNTIELYNLAIISRYKLQREVFKLTYERELIAKQDATIQGIMDLQKYDMQLERCTSRLNEIEQTIRDLERDLFNNDVISVANDIINGGK